MERHKRKARLVWALAQAAQQNFRHSLASTNRHTRHVLTAAVYINTHQHTLHFFAHMRAANKGHLEHTRTARLFSILHTRKGPQPNRFLPEGNATWGTVKCPSGGLGGRGNMVHAQADAVRRHTDSLKAGGCAFLRRTDDGSAHHTQHVLLQTAARRTMTHINTHTTRLHGRLSPERHGGCKLFPFTYPNKPRLV